MDTRDREVENALTPASPDGAAFWPIKLPAGMKFTMIRSLMDEFPVGDWGPFPSLLGAIYSKCRERHVTLL